MRNLNIVMEPRQQGGNERGKRILKWVNYIAKEYKGFPRSETIPTRQIGMQKVIEGFHYLMSKGHDKEKEEERNNIYIFT